MNREIIPKVKKIIGNSMIIAKEMDDAKIKPEHITLSILKDNNNKCVDILTTMGVDLGQMYDLIYDITIKSDISPKITESKKIRRPFNKLTKEIFNQVDEECDKLGDTMIDTRHMMLSIIAKDTLTTRVMYDLGVNYKSFKQIIKNMNEENAADDDYGFEYEEEKPKKGSKATATASAKKTPVLDNFCRDISKIAADGGLDPVVGRVKEIKRVSQILSRRKKNNPVLIGEPGVGKTAIIEGLAMLINDGKAPINLLEKKIYSLDLASIVAGTKYRGQFEERMKAILEELKANPDVVLFIDELQKIHW